MYLRARVGTVPAGTVGLLLVGCTIIVPTGHAMCFMTQYVFMTETKHLRISQKHSMRAIFMQI